MSEWAGAAAILLSLHEARKGAFRRLRESLPQAIAAKGPDVHVFEGFSGTGGAGADVQVLATRSDGRLLSWLVEIWIDWRPDDGWYATVKGEIDLDDDEGRDHCVLNEQRNVASGEQVAAAIREMAALVAEYSLDELLGAR